MPSQRLIEALLEQPDAIAQRQLLEAHIDELDDQLAQAFKAQADHLLRADIQRSFQVARLLQVVADVRCNPLYQALGLLAEANAHSLGLGEYQRAVELYDQAAAIYQAHGRVVERARSQIGKLYALSFLGRYAEVVEIGAWAGDTLEAHEQWAPLANLLNNPAIARGRMGEDAPSLALFDRVRAICLRLGPDGEGLRALIEQNRAIVLRNLGRFDESIQASQIAQALLGALEQPVEAARARQNLAMTYFVLGRYNEALALLDQSRGVFLADGRQRDAILLDLFASDCLLHLRRFADVLEACARARSLFSERGTRFEVAQALLNEATAYTGLRRYEQALAALDESQQLFEAEGNATWAATCDLERAGVLLRQGQPDACLATARVCAALFQTLPLKQAQALLLAARAAAALDQSMEALLLAAEALAIGQGAGADWLTYQARHVRAGLLRAAGDLPAALDEYDQALQDLERLRGHVMVEFRADFLVDKQAIYEDSVGLCLDLDQPLRALDYAERAKSRALLDLLSRRLDLSIQARGEEDAPLVTELTQLRGERDRLARRWESRATAREQGPPSEDERRQAEQELLALERAITASWHRLLVRNAGYARDAALWQVRSEPIQPYLDAETLLLEYFAVHGKLVAFLVTREAVRAVHLPADLAAITRLDRLLQLNMRAVPSSPPERLAGLERNARDLLGQLHALLIAPLAQALDGYPRLTIVPSGPLHYLPFHALHDGRRYLLEDHEISYLPGASLLRYAQAEQPAASGSLALGHSYGGRLPHAVDEARAVAAILGGSAYVESEATLARLRAEIGVCRVVHLAAHGDFRPDNPLFSGLALDDGWLTTLESFNLRLSASLVTLSACQTGRHVVGGGDELLGLMRALLYAGAASLLLSLWAVEDRSTATLMEAFYGKLAMGWRKGAALRHAQLAAAQAHPYFWAPFVLVGDAGAL